MANDDVIREAAYASQADRARAQTFEARDQVFRWLKEARSLRDAVQATLVQAGVAHRWEGSRLFIAGPGGEWIAGPDLRGPTAFNGWTPRIVFELAGERLVARLTWFGGGGAPPAETGYFAEGDDLVDDPDDAIDFRGAMGQPGQAPVWYGREIENDGSALTTGLSVLARSAASTVSFARLYAEIYAHTGASSLGVRVKVNGAEAVGPQTVTSAAPLELDLSPNMSIEQGDRIEVEITSVTGTTTGLWVQIDADPDTGIGDMRKEVYDPDNVEGSPFLRSNHTGTQSISTITETTVKKVMTGDERTKLGGIEAGADVTDIDNIGSSVHGAAAKATAPASDDEFAVLDSTASYAGKRITWAVLVAAFNLLYKFATVVVAASAKATPVDGDLIGIVDSEASNVLKKLTWANLKATLKAYFDTVYAPLGAGLTQLVSASATGSAFAVTSGISGKREILAFLRGVSHNSGSNIAFCMQVSDDGGSTWYPGTATSFVLSNVVSAADPVSLVVSIAVSADGKHGGVHVSAAGLTSAPFANGLVGSFSSGVFVLTNAVNAIRFLPASDSFDAGTISVYAR